MIELAVLAFATTFLVGLGAYFVAGFWVDAVVRRAAAFAAAIGFALGRYSFSATPPAFEGLAAGLGALLAAIALWVILFRIWALRTDDDPA